MRLLLEINAQNGKFPVDYKDRIRSKIHKWLRGSDKQWHDATSCYTFSNIIGTKFNPKEKIFYSKASPYFIFSSAHDDIIYELCKGINDDPSFIANANINAVQILKNDDIELAECLHTQSPIVFKFILKDEWLKNMDEKLEYIQNPENVERLNLALKKSHEAKVKSMNLNPEIFNDISFDIDSTFMKARLLRLKGQFIPALSTNVKMTGSEEAKQFAFFAGVGSKTGCGFGLLN